MAAKRILVADDDEDIREILQDSLGSYGYVVETAASGREALQKLEQRTYDGMLLDILMPDMDGLEVLREVRQRFPSLPVVMMTAIAREAAAQAVEAGAQAYVLKPFDAAQLKRIVERWFGLPGGQA